MSLEAPSIVTAFWAFEPLIQSESRVMWDEPTIWTAVALPDVQFM